MKIAADEIGKYFQKFSLFYIFPPASLVVCQDRIVSQGNDPFWSPKDRYRDWRLCYLRTERFFCSLRLLAGANQFRNLGNYNQNVGYDGVGILQRLIDKVKACGLSFSLAVSGNADVVGQRRLTCLPDNRKFRLDCLCFFRHGIDQREAYPRVFAAAHHPYEHGIGHPAPVIGGGKDDNPHQRMIDAVKSKPF